MSFFTKLADNYILFCHIRPGNNDNNDNDSNDSNNAWYLSTFSFHPSSIKSGIEAAADAFRMVDEHSGALHPDLFDQAAGYGGG